ncbi:unnamed protein product [Microthlaspi erraticum]|uniref:DUF4283 domain-containing protein n=1 Tax=Microthlaspi erraticum TaxID=1685480 RepID=A0A6D2KW77_9BRAS|nr:unnamed protein product [Microthlaspi erraticum]
MGMRITKDLVFSSGLLWIYGCDGGDLRRSLFWKEYGDNGSIWVDLDWDFGDLVYQRLQWDLVDPCSQERKGSSQEYGFISFRRFALRVERGYLQRRNEIPDLVRLILETSGSLWNIEPREVMGMDTNPGEPVCLKVVNTDYGISKNHGIDLFDNLIVRKIQRRFSVVKAIYWRDRWVFSRHSHLIISLVVIFISLLFSTLEVVMSQASLIKSGGSNKGKETLRPRLRVTLPDFDDSELIKGYSKTLIGRCVNPKKQDVQSLIFIFPRIWKIENRVTGADLGLGRFQFDFDEEEDIIEVLKMEP